MSIVKMKRLRVFGMASDREELLGRLQHMGCVEIDEPLDRLSDPDWAALTRVDDTALADAKSRAALLNAALEALKKYAPVKGGLLTPRPVISEAKLFDDELLRRALETAEAIGAQEKNIASRYSEQSKLHAQKISLSPWLELEVPLDLASTQEVSVTLGALPARSERAEVESELAQVTDLCQLTYAGVDRDFRYVLVLCHKSVEEAVFETLKKFAFTRSSLRGWSGTARENTDQVDIRLAELDRELTEAKAAVAARSGERGNLQLGVDRMDQDIRREEAKGRLLASRAVIFFEGWVPVPELKALEEFLSCHICAWETEDPVKEDYPEVPIKLKSNVITEPLTTITEMYSLPAYDGVDPNPLIMPFYVFFFGFMFADLAYGLILAGACAFIQFRTRPKGGFGQLVRLMIMCGIASATIGFFTGGFFSNFLFQFTDMLGKPMPEIPFLTVNPVIDVMNDPMTALIISLAIGLVQILTGMAVKFYMLCRDGQFWDAVWDVGTWWVIFAGIALAVLGIGSVNGIPVVLVVGCLMLLSQGRNNKGIGKITGVIGAIYNGVTGYFGDILSYSRLMVMMLAGSVIGQVFNILGSMPGNAIFFFIVFIVGHAFNMALNVIGTYVHTSRLQYLEFFKQFYREGGRPFKPLNINTKFVDIKEEQ